MSQNSKISVQAKLSTLWIFVLLNYIYGDILTLMNPHDLNNLIQGKAGPIDITEGFLLQGAIYMELSILMVLLSRLLPYKSNRLLNIIIALISGAGLIASFFVDKPAGFYIFLAVFELGGLIAIIWTAMVWKSEQTN